MESLGRAARRAVEALGARGKTTRIPDEVGGAVLEYARRARSEGESWKEISRTSGLSATLLQRWRRAGQKKAETRARLVPVVIADAAPPFSRPRLVLSTVHGDRLEGLGVDDAIRILQALR